MAVSPTHRRLRAPRRDGEALIDPPLVEMPSALAQNRESRSCFDHDVQGRSIRELSQAARRELLDLGRQYTGEYRDVDNPTVDATEVVSRPLILSGHQPELFHAGVWFKNFALSSLARACGATAINLLIDNDVCRAPAIRVPAGSAQRPRLESVPIDGANALLPYEERGIVDRDLFHSFAQRVERTIAPFVARPLVSEIWPDACSSAERTGNLGRSLSAARHRLEGRWGLTTLEAPLGAVCDLPAFRWFAAHLLGQLPRFHEVYNASLAEHRAAARIRSRTHPVPELATDGEWLEAPFWIWSADDPRRRRLFARHTGQGVEIVDRGGVRHVLPLSIDRSADAAVERLAQLAAGGLKLRPRALITTMYARLALSDYFLHGIGGAKYDELTDRIIARFFACQPPAYGVATATLLLPIDRPAVTGEEFCRTDRELRDMHFNPDRHLDNGAACDETVAALVREKHNWIAAELPKGERRGRHRTIEELNRRLETYVADERERLRVERVRLAEQLRIARLLGSREFSFCLFPAETLPRMLLELSHYKP
jgi:hypothetical protein